MPTPTTRLRHVILAGVLLTGLTHLTPGALAASVQLLDILPNAQQHTIQLKLKGGTTQTEIQARPARHGIYQTTVTLANLEATSWLMNNLPSVKKNLSTAYPEIRSVEIIAMPDANPPGVQLILNSAAPLPLSVSATQGSVITLLVGEPASPTPPPTETHQAIPHNPPVRQNTSFMPSAAPAGTPYNMTAAVKQPATALAVQDAWIQYQRGDYTLALGTLQSHLSHQPTDANANFLKALCHTALHQPGEAEGALNAIVESQVPGNPVLSAALTRLAMMALDRRDWQAARPRILALKQEGAGAPPVMTRYLLGLLAERENRLEDAAALYEGILAEDPYHISGHQRLAKVALRQNKTAQAKSELEETLLLYPDDAATTKIMGFIHQRSHNPDEALAYYRKALQPDVMINVASLLKQQQKPAEAVALLNAVREIAGDNPDVLYNLGMLYAELNQPVQAETVLQRFLDKQAGLTTPADKRLEKARQTLQSLNRGG
ncbi:MAG: tetratricopeptide repeat protein [Candidatus Melainabacteria bacterium]